MKDRNDLRNSAQGDGASQPDAGSLVHDVSVHSEEIRGDVQRDRLNAHKGRDFVRLLLRGLLFVLIPIVALEFGIRVVAASRIGSK